MVGMGFWLMIENFDVAAFLQNPVKLSALVLTVVLLAVCIVLHFFRRSPAVSRARAYSIYLQLAFVFSSTLTVALATTCAAMLLPCQFSGIASIAAFSVPVAIALVVLFGPSLIARIYAFYSKARRVKSGALWARVKEISALSGASVPALYIVDSASPSAFSFSGKNSAIFVSVGMLDILGKNELDAVLLHELAHIRAGSSTFKLSIAVLRAFSPFSRINSFNRELSCDEDAADLFAAGMQGTARFLRSAKKKLDAYHSH